MLKIKLDHLPGWTVRREDLAGRYHEELNDLPLQLPATGPDRSHVWHLYVVRHPERDRLRAALADHSIQTGLHYPTPVHMQPAYAHLGYTVGDFRVSEQVSSECLSLPLFPEMSDIQQEAVIAALSEIV